MTTNDEKRVLAHLADAWNAYIKLPDQHPSDREEFMRAIHCAQNLIACRVARAADAATWPTYADPVRSAAPRVLPRITEEFA